MAAVAERQAGDVVQQQDREMEELATGPIPIAQLTSKGVSAGDIKKLIEGGVHTIECLAHLSKKELCAIKGVSENKVEKLQQVAWTIIPMGFTTATVIAENQAEKVMIHTGCKEVDAILEGGLEAGSITEIYGEYRCGKTQFCHTLCVTCQLPLQQGGGEGKALYIDTEGTFRPQRLHQIAERFNLNPSDVLDNVAYARAHNTDHQAQVSPPPPPQTHTHRRRPTDTEAQAEASEPRLTSLLLLPSLFVLSFALASSSLQRPP